MPDQNVRAVFHYSGPSEEREARIYALSFCSVFHVPAERKVGRKNSHIARCSSGTEEVTRDYQVYSYSLKEGINDGFLRLFKVKKITTSLDEYTYDSDINVVEGEIEEGKRIKRKPAGYYLIKPGMKCLID